MLTKVFVYSILNSMSYKYVESFFPFFSFYFFTFETALSHLTFVCDLSLRVMSHAIYVVLFIFVTRKTDAYKRAPRKPSDQSVHSSLFTF